MKSVAWWADCFPQWKGQMMTTPDGRPSVQPNANVLNGLQGDELSRQAGINPETSVVGTNMNKVDDQYTEGATVGDDQASMPAPAPPDTDEL
jgi:hypothetical protein